LKNLNRDLSNNMAVKHLSYKAILMLVVTFAVVLLTIRRTEEKVFIWSGDSEVIPSSAVEDTRIELPRLPDNASLEIFETTPPQVFPNSETPPSNPSPKKILYNVPFLSQAPTGKWYDARFQDGCEEASVLMAMRWIEGKTITAQEAEKEIIAISEFEQKTFGTFHDTSVQDTVEHIVKGYFKYDNANVQYDITPGDIQKELEVGHLVIVPANGQVLDNPYYTPPGPDHHMVLIIGYDPATDEFITNDPGTRHGKSFRYPASTLGAAIRDYPTGDHKPVTEDRTAMIVVKK